jgi:Domain of unknown function (DUF4160)
MPKLCEFYGIKIYMYWNDSEQHNSPHIHAYYAEHQAVIDLKGNVLSGWLPKTAKKLTKKWLLENLASLEYAWEQARANKPLPKIKELK